jgi:HAD superfamily hydrolase (TIGR01509 family)
VPFSARVLVLYRSINDALWAAYRRGEIAQAELEVERFRRLLRALGVPEEEAGGLSHDFLTLLAGRGDRLPGCRRLLAALRPRFRLGVVTNGIDRVQQARLQAARLRPFFEAIVTSEGCGFAKPDPRILLTALQALGVGAGEAVYVGDDLAVDGAAASGAGMSFVWVDRGDPMPRGQPRPRHRVTHLGQLAERFAL